MSAKVLDKSATHENYVEELNPETHWTDAEEKESRQSRLLIPVFGVVAILGISAFIVSIIKRPTSPAEPVSLFRDIDHLIPDVEVDKFLENLAPEELEKLIGERTRAYLSCGTIDQCLNHVFHYDDLRKKMTKFYQRYPEALVPKELTDFTIVSHNLGEVPLYAVAAILKNQEEPVYLTILSENQRLLVDWESTVGYSENSLEEIKSQQLSESTQSRVFIRLPASASKRKIPGEFRIAQTIFGPITRLYIDPQSEAYRRVRRQVLEPDDAAAYNILLHYDREERQLVLDKILHPYWFNKKRYLEEYRAQPASSG